MKTEYKLTELTPESMMCLPFGGCPAIYELERKTPESMACWPTPGCPEIYELKGKTPEEMCPPFGSCPEIYAGKEDNYIIVGTQVDPSEFGLEGKVGEGEVLISVPKKLIDEKQA